jgi:hypothetical protein
MNNDNINQDVFQGEEDEEAWREEGDPDDGMAGAGAGDAGGLPELEEVELNEVEEVEQLELNIAVDELLGIRGALTSLLRNLVWLLAFNGAFLGLFVFVPFTIGCSTIAALSQYFAVDLRVHQPLHPLHELHLHHGLRFWQGSQAPAEIFGLPSWDLEHAMALGISTKTWYRVEEETRQAGWTAVRDEAGTEGAGKQEVVDMVRVWGRLSPQLRLDVEEEVGQPSVYNSSTDNSSVPLAVDIGRRYMNRWAPGPEVHTAVEAASKTIHVASVPPKTTKEELKMVFANFGSVEEVRMNAAATDQFAFVDFKLAEEAQQAVGGMDALKVSMKIDGSFLNVELSMAKNVIEQQQNLQTIKAIIQKALAESVKKGHAIQVQDVLTTALGYIVVSAILLCWRFAIAGLHSLGVLRCVVVENLLWVLEGMAAVIKVTSLLCLKMLLLPVMLGGGIDLATLELLDASLHDRVAFSVEHMLGSLLLHWVLGITFMLLVTVSVLQLREVVHPDVLARIIRPQEAHPDLLKTLLGESCVKHGRRMVMSLLIYALLLLLLVWFPVQAFAYLTPSLLPVKPRLFYIVPEFQVPLELLLFHMAVLALLERYKNKIGDLQHSWMVVACRTLDLTEYLLPLPAVVAEEQEKEEAEEELVAEEEEEEEVGETKEGEEGGDVRTRRRSSSGRNLQRDAENVNDDGAVRRPAPNALPLRPPPLRFVPRQQQQQQQFIVQRPRNNENDGVGEAEDNRANANDANDANANAPNANRNANANVPNVHGRVNGHVLVRRFPWPEGLDEPPELALAPRKTPTHCGLRVIALLVWGWITVLCVSSLYLIIPLTIGRGAFTLLHVPPSLAHDPLALAVGAASFWLLVSWATLVCTAVVQDFQHAAAQRRAARATAAATQHLADYETRVAAAAAAAAEAGSANVNPVPPSTASEGPLRAALRRSIQGMLSAPARKLVEFTAAAVLWLCVAPVCFGLLFEVLLVVPLQRLQMSQMVLAATQAAQAAVAAAVAAAVPGAQAIAGASCDAAASTAASTAAADTAAALLAGTGLFFSGERNVLLGGLQLAFVQDWVLGVVFLQLWAYGLIAGVFDGNHNGDNGGENQEDEGGEGGEWRAEEGTTWKGRVTSAWRQLQKAAAGNWQEVDSSMLLHW